MLEMLRQGAQSMVSKVLMLILGISFAIWGIGGFQGFHANTLATVGGHEVTGQEFARVFSNAQRNARQSGKPVNPEQVLSSVLLNAAIDDAANDYGLGISNDRVAAEIAKNPAFQRPDGSFDRDRFAGLLDNAGIGRDDYIHDVKQGLVREQIAGSLSAGLSVPQPLVAALYRLGNEERSVSFFVVDQTSITPVGAPGETDLNAYFDSSKDSFRAPEYRKLGLIALDPEAIADPASVTEDEIAAEYANRKASLTQPERRRVEQARFDTADAAKAAFARVEGGEDLSAVAQSSGVEVTDLGVKSKAEMLDPAIADAAFSAVANKPVQVIEGALQPSIIRVTAIEPGSVPSLQEMEPRLRKELAVRAAHDRVQDLNDQLEDERAGGATLEEAARKFSLSYRVIDAVSAEMKAPDGNALNDIPGGAALVKEAFDSDVGVENSPFRVNADSWVFYDVLDVQKARDRSLDEVRDKVLAAWTEAETGKRIAARADALFDRLKTGASPASLAAEVGKPVQTAEGLKRNGASPNLTPNAIGQAFAGPEGHVANADGVGQARILLSVDKVTVPAFFAEATDATAIQSQVSSALQNDLLTTYNQQLLASRSTSINTVAFQQLTGQAQTQ